jgi:SnoaL-like protein
VGFPRDEIESAFVRYWGSGAVGEDWDAWVECFTDDVQYVEHVLGSLRGREAVRAWIKPIMAQYGELYTAYEWHMVDPETGRVCVYMQNRRDHPSGQGTIDFPGITILEYARRPLPDGGGLLGRPAGDAGDAGVRGRLPRARPRSRGEAHAARLGPRPVVDARRPLVGGAPAGARALSRRSLPAACHGSAASL